MFDIAVWGPNSTSENYVSHYVHPQTLLYLLVCPPLS